MKKQVCFLIVLLMVGLPLYVFADTCDVCDGAGYLYKPAFLTNEMVEVTCTACGGESTPTTEIISPEQHVSSITLPDPIEYADGDMACTYAEKGYAVFQGEYGYDIDSYIAAIISATGLEITGKFEYYGGNIRYYQLSYSGLTGPLYQETCHATVYFAKTGTIALATVPGGNVQLPACASVALPDPSIFAKGEDRIKSQNINGVSFICEEGYDYEGYIDLLRYEYGFDVEAVERIGADGIRYGLNNVDIDTALFPISYSLPVNRATRQLEIEYYFSGANGGVLLFELPYDDVSIIQLPLRDEDYYRSSVEFNLPEPPSKIGCDVTAGDESCSYTFSKDYDPLPYVVDLIEAGFTITGIVENDDEITFYLFKPGYHVERIHHDTAHVGVSYDSLDKKLTIEKAAYSLALPKSGQPTSKPKDTPAPNPTGGGGGGTPIIDDTEERCSICGGDGWRTCGTCYGNGDIDCGGCYGNEPCSQCGGDGRRDCPNFNCRGGEVECWTCGGDGKK